MEATRRLCSQRENEECAIGLDGVTAAAEHLPLNLAPQLPDKKTYQSFGHTSPDERTAARRRPAKSVGLLPTGFSEAWLRCSMDRRPMNDGNRSRLTDV